MAGFRVNRKTLARGGVRAGSDASNYTDLSTGGFQTMSGCARAWNQINLPAAVWQTFDSASTGALSGSVFVNLPGGASNAQFRIRTITGSGTGCDMQFDTTIFAPPDAALSGSMALYLDYIVSGTVSTASTIGTKVLWNFTNGVGTCSVVSGSASYAASLLSASAAGTHFETPLNTCLPSFSKVGQMLNLHGVMLTGACSAGTQVDFAGARLLYLADRVGASAP